ncbi:MAG: 5-oxoprolinase subunit PxpB [Chloroflexota bacterium]
MDRPGIGPFGDSALLLTFGDEIDEKVSRRVRAAARALGRLGDDQAGIGAPVAAYASILLPFDPLATSPEAAARLALKALATAPADDTEPEAATIEIPTRYGGEDGPDLLEVAEAHGLTVPQAIECHGGATYTVAFLGFMPGFPYLIGGPAELDHPRRPTPRTRVAAGSVAIAGTQGTIYPFASPGGWNLVGRTDVRPWDAQRDPPALFASGARVRFVPAPDR